MIETFTVILGALLVGYIAGGMSFLAGLFFSNKAHSDAKPFVTVIVAARNEASSIEDCIRRLLQQTYPAYEVIVVDDRSNDKTAEIVRAFSNDRLKLITVTETPTRVSPKKHALEQGIRMAKGEILLFTDADCLVPGTWIEGMIRHFTPKIGVVIGFSEVKAGSFFEKLQKIDFHAMMFAACGMANLGRPWSASGQNLAYRRDAYDRVNGFASVRDRISGDDVLMMNLIRCKTNYGVVFSCDPSTFVTTKPVSSMTAFFQQRARWASNGTIMSRLNPVFFCYLIVVYGMALWLSVGGVVSVFYDNVLPIWLFCGAIKLTVDGAVMIQGSRLFQRRFNAGVFAVWFLVQSPYVVWAGLRGMVGSFRWK